MRGRCRPLHLLRRSPSPATRGRIRGGAAGDPPPFTGEGDQRSWWRGRPEARFRRRRKCVLRSTHPRVIPAQAGTHPEMSPPTPARRSEAGSRSAPGSPVCFCIYPPNPPTALSSPPSAAPKRDHDEWLVRGRPGGAGVAPCQAESTSGASRFAGDAATERDGGAMPAPPRIGSCRARAAGRGSRDGPKGSLPAKTLRSRDAARDAPGPSCHTPKTPAGRRGASLFQLRTTRVRQPPRRPRFVL